MMKDNNEDPKTSVSSRTISETSLTGNTAAECVRPASHQPDNASPSGTHQPDDPVRLLTLTAVAQHATPLPGRVHGHHRPLRTAVSGDAGDEGIKLASQGLVVFA